MSNFITRPPFSNSLWVGIETMQFHIAQTKFFLRTPWFPIQGVPMNNLAPMKNCPGGGVQGNLNWMPGYYTVHYICRKRSILNVIIIVNLALWADNCLCKSKHNNKPYIIYRLCLNLNIVGKVLPQKNYY